MTVLGVVVGGHELQAGAGVLRRTLVWGGIKRRHLEGLELVAVGVVGVVGVRLGLDMASLGLLRLLLDMDLDLGLLGLLVLLVLLDLLGLWVLWGLWGLLCLCTQDTVLDEEGDQELDGQRNISLLGQQGKHTHATLKPVAD